MLEGPKKQEGPAAGSDSPGNKGGDKLPDGKPPREPNDIDKVRKELGPEPPKNEPNEGLKGPKPKEQ